MRIDSYKSEKRALQKITNTISVRLSPSAEDVSTVSEYIEGVVSAQKSFHNRPDPGILQAATEAQRLSSNDQIRAVLN